jgi:hypothetical protein
VATWHALEDCEKIVNKTRHEKVAKDRTREAEKFGRRVLHFFAQN